MKGWYVPGQGLVRSNQVPTGEAYPLDEATYRHVHDYFEFIHLTVSNNQLHLHFDLEAYRRHALAKVAPVNYVDFCGVRVYDDEHPFLSDGYYTRDGQNCTLEKDEHIALVHARNRLHALKRAGISRAVSYQEIDRFLGIKE